LRLTATFDVDPTVDLHVDHPSRSFNKDPETTRRSTYKVEGGVDVYVAV
jgi:hypothetical protein